MNKLQKVQNLATVIIFRISKYEHIQSYLKELHWLPVSARIEHKIAYLCYKSITHSKFPPSIIVREPAIHIMYKDLAKFGHKANFCCFLLYMVW